MPILRFFALLGQLTALNGGEIINWLQKKTATGIGNLPPEI